MRLIARWAPLLICIREGMPEVDEVTQLAEAFEPHFRSAAPYAVLNVARVTARPPSARERFRIAEWANQENVRLATRALCIGSATVVARDWERHALVALQWLWTPAAPHHAVPTVAEGIEYCISVLTSRGLELPLSSETFFKSVEQALQLEGVVGIASSERRTATAPYVRPSDSQLDSLSDAGGAIHVGWIVPGVLWARLRGRLSGGLAAAYTSRLQHLLGACSGAEFFIDASELHSYELQARDLTTTFLVSRQHHFSRLTLLNWSGGVSPVGKAAADLLGQALRFAADRQEFDALLHIAAPTAAIKIAAFERSTAPTRGQSPRG